MAYANERGRMNEHVRYQINDIDQIPRRWSGCKSDRDTEHPELQGDCRHRFGYSDAIGTEAAKHDIYFLMEIVPG
jgi:hypothetical protein